MIGIPVENRRKGNEKIFDEIIVENFSKWVRNSYSSPGSPEIPIQDKPKANHIKAHNNQTNKN